MVLPLANLSEAKRVVLVVEDEILVRMLIAEYLRDEGYQVVEAGNAGEAFEYLRMPNRVELVFSDVRMPGTFDGLQLARRLRALYPQLPVILTSGHLLPDEAGETPLVLKPYILAEVAAKIRAVIGGGSPDSVGE